jgi:hypothetical protein
MRMKASTQMAHDTALSANARRFGRVRKTAGIALVAALSVSGLTLGLIEAFGSPRLTLAVAAACAALCSLGVAALAGIAAADWRSPR